MEFKVVIDIGNDAMQTGSDVAGALAKLANRIEDDTLPFIPGDGAQITDVNGNTVGVWTVES